MSEFVIHYRLQTESNHKQWRDWTVPRAESTWDQVCLQLEIHLGLLKPNNLMGKQAVDWYRDGGLFIGFRLCTGSEMPLKLVAAKPEDACSKLGSVRVQELLNTNADRQLLRARDVLKARDQIILRRVPWQMKCNISAYIFGQQFAQYPFVEDTYVNELARTRPKTLSAEETGKYERGVKRSHVQLMSSRAETTHPSQQDEKQMRMNNKRLKHSSAAGLMMYELLEIQSDDACAQQLPTYLKEGKIYVKRTEYALWHKEQLSSPSL